MTREMLRSTAVAHAMVTLLAHAQGPCDPRVAIGFDALMDELADEVAKASQAETAAQEELIQRMRDRAADVVGAVDQDGRSDAGEALMEAFTSFAGTVPGYHG